MAEHSRIPVLDLAPELDEVGPALEAAFRRVMASGHFILGPEVDAFEREVAEYLGVRYAIGVNSGTDALVIALRALGIGPGDEVVTSPFTFFATPESVSVVGATPVFVDVDPETFNLRPELVARAITPRTKAILPVHLFGHAADLEALQSLARAKGLRIVEDVAQAFGGSLNGRKLGTFGDAGAFSFFPSKNLGCLGDGGLVATNDAEVADAARMLRAHGSRKKYENEQIGYNSRLDALQAAFLRAKLPHVDAWNAGRREAAIRYRELLAGVPGIVLPSERQGVRHVYHQFTIRVLDGRRDALKAALADAGVDTMVYYPKAAHRLPVYEGFGEFPQADAASGEVLSLPMWPRIPVAVQERVARALREAKARG
ncbi:DegT/DnrJ/EryC1/StrS family aminotransferase [Anaeromyxobacter soli]|uniref:DegT/DnrJ/EryC1/StrS family aminotransferase n=1 Tax=Anaeromyxobacter soli TaxID=2922725 RepID=UPI001FAF5A6B|nr:DegT/DnrJ/EryC1/StrS family aminotransferase [Anaeromyxobacter sp. SG29]